MFKKLKAWIQKRDFDRHVDSVMAMLDEKYTPGYAADHTEG